MGDGRGTGGFVLVGLRWYLGFVSPSPLLPRSLPPSLFTSHINYRADYARESGTGVERRMGGGGARARRKLWHDDDDDDVFLLVFSVLNARTLFFFFFGFCLVFS